MMRFRYYGCGALGRHCYEVLREVIRLTLSLLIFGKLRLFATKESSGRCLIPNQAVKQIHETLTLTRNAGQAGPSVPRFGVQGLSEPGEEHGPDGHHPD